MTTFIDAGPQADIKYLDPTLLHIDPRYQRGEKPHTIKRITKSLNWKSFGTLTVFKRQDGSGYWVVDGQQRLTAIRNLIAAKHTANFIRHHRAQVG